MYAKWRNTLKHQDIIFSLQSIILVSTIPALVTGTGCRKSMLMHLFFIWLVLGLKHRVNYLESKLNMGILSENVPCPLPNSSLFITMSIAFIVSISLKWNVRILELITMLKVYLYSSFSHCNYEDCLWILELPSSSDF